MYIPKDCTTLENAKEAQIRLGLQGDFGTGKTFAALTFPNTVVLNVDRGLGIHHGRKDVIEVKIYDKEFCKKIEPTFGPSNPKIGVKDVIEKWLRTEATKLEEDQTLVIDGITGIQNAYHSWYPYNVVYTKRGQENEFGEWNVKLVFFGFIFDLIKTLKCHVVVICHETDKKEKGEYTGKIRPLLRGQFGDELGSHFTDFFRALSMSKPKDISSIKEDNLRHWRMTKTEFWEMCQTFTGDAIYFWQTESDDVFNGKASSLFNPPKFVPANYSIFKKYAKNFSQA